MPSAPRSPWSSTASEMKGWESKCPLESTTRTFPVFSVTNSRPSGAKAIATGCARLVTTRVSVRPAGTAKSVRGSRGSVRQCRTDNDFGISKSSGISPSPLYSGEREQYSRRHDELRLVRCGFIGVEAGRRARAGGILDHQRDEAHARLLLPAQV